jgi:ubiquinone/menaquinone biosynthesis C-methylase UbiE
MSILRTTIYWIGRLYIWATYRLYNEFAWAYDLASWVVSLGHWAGWRSMALDHVVGQRVLEVGFGTGELLIEGARRGLQMHGLDLSLAMQRVTARKMRHSDVWVPRVRALVQRTPFADGSFDSIVSTFPAAYILDPATLQEVARLLREPDANSDTPGGRFVVVGLTATTNSPLLRRAARAIFGVPGETIFDVYGRTAKAAGLDVTVNHHESGIVTMPVFIAERPAHTHTTRKSPAASPADGAQDTTEGIRVD